METEGTWAEPRWQLFDLRPPLKILFLRLQMDQDFIKIRRSDPDETTDLAQQMPQEAALE